MDLPSEIRLKIYELLFVHDKTIQVADIRCLPDANSIESSKITFTLSSRMYTLLDLSPQLLRVCRKICDAALPVLYGSNRFASGAYYPPRSSRGLGDCGCVNIGSRNTEMIRYLDYSSFVTLTDIVDSHGLVANLLSILPDLRSLKGLRLCDKANWTSPEVGDILRCKMPGVFSHHKHLCRVATWEENGAEDSARRGFTHIVLFAHKERVPNEVSSCGEKVCGAPDVDCYFSTRKSVLRQSFTNEWLACS